jgi:hypothetical protein
MFDAGYCSGMTLGRLEISIDGLNELTYRSARIGSEAHNPVLQRRRREIVRRSRYRNRAQLVLELERQIPQAPVSANTKGVVEVLADLLLEALVAETDKGGRDEREDHT